MKKNLLLSFAIFLFSFRLFSQCQVACYVLMPDCDSLCNGTMQAQPIGGTPPYSYLWSNGNTTAIATNLCASTSYSVTITDSTGCVASSWNTIPSVMQVSITVISPPSCPSCCDGILQGNCVYPNCSPYSLSWNPYISNNSYATNVCLGTYSFCVANACGCIRCATQVLAFPTGIKNNCSSSPSFSPQPFSESSTLQLPIEIINATMEIYNIDGILVRQETAITGTQIIFERKNLSEGCYFYRISKENTILYSGHFIISE